MCTPRYVHITSGSRSCLAFARRQWDEMVPVFRCLEVSFRSGVGASGVGSDAAPF